VNPWVNRIEGSRYLQSLLAPGIEFGAYQRDVGLTGSNRKDVASRGDSQYFKTWVSPQRFRQELATHTVAIRNQDLNALCRLRTVC
jgi:hypothetical protein